MEIRGKNSLQRNLPLDWITSALNDICINIIGGGTPSRENSNYFKGDIIWLTPTQIPKDKIIVIKNSQEKITNSGLKNSSA